MYAIKLHAYTNSPHDLARIFACVYADIVDPSVIITKRGKGEYAQKCTYAHPAAYAYANSATKWTRLQRKLGMHSTARTARHRFRS